MSDIASVKVEIESVDVREGCDLVNVEVECDPMDVKAEYETVDVKEECETVYVKTECESEDMKEDCIEKKEMIVLASSSTKGRRYGNISYLKILNVNVKNNPYYMN